MTRRRHPQSSIDSAVAAYGRETATQLAKRLRCSTGAVVHWWAAAKADGRITAAFGRFDGASKEHRLPPKKRSSRVVPGFAPHEAGPNRPDCRTPDACISKGPTHCRGCTGAVMMARLLSDPERVAARMAKSIAGRDTEAFREAHRQKLAKQRRNKSFRQAEIARGRLLVAEWNADPIIKAKASESQRVKLTAQWSERVAVPIPLMPEFRALRRKRYSVQEAREILRQANRAEFERFDAAHRAAAMKSIGPAPAIGMPERAAWTRRAEAVIAGLAKTASSPLSSNMEG